MAVSYNRLWKLLIDREWKKSKLVLESGVSMPTISRMVKGKHVSTEVLEKICKALDCEVQDIMEFVEDKPVKKQEIEEPKS